MTPKQYEILKRAYESLDVSLDSDDYTAIGKLIVVRRKLAELLGVSIKNNPLPGEYFDDEDDEELENRFINKSPQDTPLTENEKKFIKHCLNLLSNVGGLSDSDDACLRCSTRMLAELCDYEPLAHYRLLYEKEVKRMYYKD